MAKKEQTSRAWTQEEVMEQFLHHCWSLVRYWEKTDSHLGREMTVQRRLEGLMHSFLTMLDGMTIGFPAFKVIPDPHEHSKQYNIEHGNNYYDDGPLKKRPDVHGPHLLNDLMYEFGRKHGYVKD